MTSTNPNTFVLARKVGISVPGRLKQCAQIQELDVDADVGNKKITSKWKPKPPFLTRSFFIPFCSSFMHSSFVVNPSGVMKGCRKIKMP
jgi:hypothetical protein